MSALREYSEVSALYEAARLDGANGVQQFTAITLPMLKQNVIVCILLAVTGGFAGETWAVVEWTFSGIRPETGYELTFRGASVLELEDGLQYINLSHG